MLHSRLSQTSFENKACRLAKNGEKEKPGNKDVQIEHAIILSTALNFFTSHQFCR